MSQVSRRRFWLAFVLAMVIVALVSVIYVRSGHNYVRGAWITGYGTGYLSSGEIDRTIAAAKAAKLNTIIVEVRRSADAYYQSGLEPVASGIEPGFDPLAGLLKKAHKEGIRVHAWVSVYRIWRGGLESAPADHLARQHPEWLARSYDGALEVQDGIFLDPGVPDAVNHNTRIIADIVRRYDIDGLHLDFVRYPSENWGYSEIALKRYRAETGTKAKPLPDDPQWQEWKRRQVTASVRTIRQEVRRIKPNLPISAATIAYGRCPSEFSDTYAYKYLGQDWQGWLEEGLIDANMPMNYRDTRQSDKQAEFSEWLDAFGKWDGGKPVFVGLATYTSDAKTVESQIEQVRRAGLDGFVVFCFNESGMRVGESRGTLVRALSRTDSLLKRWPAAPGRFRDGR